MLYIHIDAFLTHGYALYMSSDRSRSLTQNQANAYYMPEPQPVIYDGSQSCITHLIGADIVACIIINDGMR